MNESYDWQEHVPEHPAESAMITLVIYALLIVIVGALPAMLSLAG
jgi:hypothetical protein